MALQFSVFFPLFGYLYAHVGHIHVCMLVQMSVGLFLLVTVFLPVLFFFFFFVFFFFFFWFLFFSRQVSLYRPGCAGTHSVDQACLELRNPPASASQVLGLKACATNAQLFIFLRFIYFVLRVHHCFLHTHQKRASDLITHGCEPPYDCSELNLGLLKEQLVLLTAESLVTVLLL
jgi:hypothetical protein